MVSRAFPPANGSGDQRIGKLAKYLPDFGWEPIVLTISSKRKGALRTLPVEINESNVIRTPYFSLGPYIYQLPLLRMLPHPLGWYPYGIKAGCRILTNYKFDAIFSSYSPSSSHFIASRLQRRSGIPWVAEFRDLWALNPYARTTQFLRLLEQKVERKIVKNSSLLITVSEGLARRLGEMTSKRVAIIPNGFDEEDYLGNAALTAKFTITYTGQVNPGSRDPSPVFDAVSQLNGEGKISPANFEVRFFGGSSGDFLPSLIRKYHLKDLVKFYGFVSFKESIKRQRESTALLLLEWNDPRGRDTSTGKIYGYLGARRPILATGYPGGAIDNLLRESGTGILANEVEMIREVLSCWLGQWRRSGKITSYWKPDENVIKRYTRREGARKLAELLEEASA